MDASILIVDDNLKLGEILSRNFVQAGFRARAATDGEGALRAVEAGAADVVLLDLRLGNEDGIEVLRRIRAANAKLPVLLVTAYGSIESAVEAVRMGAFDYVQKPVPFPRLLQLVENALAKSAAAEGPRGAFPFISRNPAFLSVVAMLERLSATDFPILLIGESGTGKELFADYVHGRSPRAPRELQKVNCAGLPPSLLDNELFGHDKGAYTGADAAFPGIFERADKSTLFLDEIGDMPPEIQAKILRTLQNQEIRRLGGKRDIRIDVRFIAATNKDVPAMVAAGTFREDLYYRLNTAVFTIPPLRERPEDIPALAEHFLAGLRGTGTVARGFSAGALEAMAAYRWPGNVRELKNAVSYAATLAAGELVLPADLPAPVLRPGAVPGPAGGLPEEKARILEALRAAGGNKKAAADALRISRRTLYNKLEKHGIAP